MIQSPGFGLVATMITNDFSRKRFSFVAIALFSSQSAIALIPLHSFLNLLSLLLLPQPQNQPARKYLPEILQLGKN